MILMAGIIVENKNSIKRIIRYCCLTDSLYIFFKTEFVIYSIKKSQKFTI